MGEKMNGEYDAALMVIFTNSNLSNYPWPNIVAIIAPKPCRVPGETRSD
jgi:hypothetical protein